MKPEQERVKNLLTDTLTLLCKNGLNYRKELKVQGLLGITTDEEDVFIVHINEKFGNELGISVSLGSEWKEGASPLAAALSREKPQRKERSSDLAERRESGRHEKVRSRKRPPDSPQTASPVMSPSQKNNQTHPAPFESPLSKYPRESSSHDEDSQSTVQSSIQISTIKIKQEEDDVIIMDKKPCMEDRIPQDDGTFGIPGQTLSDQNAMQHSYGSVSLQDIQSGFPRFDPISNSTLTSNRTSKRSINMSVQESTDQSHSTDFSSEADIPGAFITGMVEHVSDQPGGPEGDNSDASWDNPALGPLTSDGQVLLENAPGCSTWDSSQLQAGIRPHGTSQSDETSESVTRTPSAWTSLDQTESYCRTSKYHSTRTAICRYSGCGKAYYHSRELYRHQREKHGHMVMVKRHIRKKGFHRN